MSNTPNKVSVDGEVFKLQSLIEAGQQALENFEARSNQLLSEESLVNIFNLAMNKDEFRKAFVSAIVTQIGSTRMIKEVALSSKEDIKEAIYARVQTLLTTEALAPAVSQILNMVSNGNLPELPDVMNTPSLETLKPDSVENVSQILKILAGDKAWKS